MLGLTGGLAAAVLAGCTREGSLAPAGDTPTSPGPSTSVPLKQWYHQYGEAGTRQAVERYAAAFPRGPVEVGWIPGDFDQAVGDALPTDQAPDVFEMANGPSVEMLRGGQVADLTDVIGDAVADFDPVIIKRFTHQDRIWAIPQVIDMQMLVYRPSMLRAAGVTPPSSMDELVAAAGALTRGKVKGLYLGNDAGASVVGPLMLRSAGLDLLTPDGRIGFDDPAAARALSVLRTLATSGHLLRNASADWYSPTALTSGRTAMQFTGLWALPAIQKALGDDVGVLPWPAMRGGVANVPLGSYGACVNAGSRQVDRAKDLVRWLWIDSTDRQLDFATGYGLHLPARTSLAASAPVLSTGPAADAAHLAARHGFIQTHLLWTRACELAFTDAMTRIVLGGVDPGRELRNLRPVISEQVRAGGV